jgi:hypothetical protein
MRQKNSIAAFHHHQLIPTTEGNTPYQDNKIPLLLIFFRFDGDDNNNCIVVYILYPKF